MKNTQVLHKLASEINSREEVIQALRQQAIDKATEAGTEILLQGRALLKVETEYQGDEVAWLAANCPAVDEDDARAYKRVARNPGRFQDPNQLLLAVWHERNESACPTDGEPSPYLTALESMGKWLRGLSKRPPIPTWPDGCKDRLRDQLLPVAKTLWPERFE